MKAWLCIALIAACGRGGGETAKKAKGIEEVRAAWGTKVKARLEKVVAAATAAKSAELGAPGDAPLALDFEWNDPKAKPNAFAVLVDDVLSATEPRPEPVKKDAAAAAAEEIQKAVAEGRDPVLNLEAPVSHPAFTLPPAGYFHVQKAKGLLGISSAFEAPEYIYDQFVSAKYMLVITPTKVSWPKQTGMTFEMGAANLRGVLIEIETAKPLGGFEAMAKSSDKVKVPPSPTGVNADLQKHTDSVQRTLDNDFLGELGTAIVTGIETRWPGTKTPPDLEH